MLFFFFFNEVGSGLTTVSIRDLSDRSLVPVLGAHDAIHDAYIQLSRNWEEALSFVEVGTGLAEGDETNVVTSLGKLRMMVSVNATTASSVVVQIMYQDRNGKKVYSGERTLEHSGVGTNMVVIVENLYGAMSTAIRIKSLASGTADAHIAFI